MMDYMKLSQYKLSCVKFMLRLNIYLIFNIISKNLLKKKKKLHNHRILKRNRPFVYELVLRTQRAYISDVRYVPLFDLPSSFCLQP